MKILEAHRLRLGTLVQIRWLAAGGQAAALIVSATFLHIRFSFWLTGVCWGLLLAFNILLWLCISPTKRLHDKTATLILALDISQLGLMLFLTGGLANPFAMLLIAPTMISAVSQSWLETVKLLALALLYAVLLAFWNLPLRLSDGIIYAPPPIAIAGTLVAIVVSAIFVALYGGQVAKEARQLAMALNATEHILARERHLSELDGLAAAAAHEFGTPLATLTVIIHELAAQKEIAALCGEDLALAQQELARCRHILSRLSLAHRLEEPENDILDIETLLEEIASPCRLQGIAIAVQAYGNAPRPVMTRNPALFHGLRNVIDNAVSFAVAQVQIVATWDETQRTIRIRDDGPGFPPLVLQSFGEPYISQRKAASTSEEKPGLGLGLFIAKVLLERTGATLTLANLPAPQHGAEVVVSWPSARI